jgi:hypothetical protein
VTRQNLYIAAYPHIEAHQWHTHGDHPRDDAATGALFVQRYEGQVVELVKQIEDAHALNAHCTVPWEAHGFILQPDTMNADTVNGTLVIVCPGDYVARNVTDPEYADVYRSFSADQFGQMMVPLDAHQCVDGRFKNLLLDLDRCQHGRHAADPCSSCPGYQSTGNQLIPPGTLIGTFLHGRIVVPPNEKRYDPLAWKVPDAELWDQLAESAARSQSLMRVGLAALAFHTTLGTRDTQVDLERALAEHQQQFPERP